MIVLVFLLFFRIFCIGPHPNLSEEEDRRFLYGSR